MSSPRADGTLTGDGIATKRERLLLDFRHTVDVFDLQVCEVSGKRCSIAMVCPLREVDHKDLLELYEE